MKLSPYETWNGLCCHAVINARILVSVMRVTRVCQVASYQVNLLTILIGLLRKGIITGLTISNSQKMILDVSFWNINAIVIDEVKLTF